MILFNLLQCKADSNPLLLSFHMDPARKPLSRQTSTRAEKDNERKAIQMDEWAKAHNRIVVEWLIYDGNLWW